MIVSMKCPYCTTTMNRYVENDLHEAVTKEKMFTDHCKAKHPEKVILDIEAPIVDMSWRRSRRIDYGTGMI